MFLINTTDENSATWKNVGKMKSRNREKCLREKVPNFFFIKFQQKEKRHLD